MIKLIEQVSPNFLMFSVENSRNIEKKKTVDRNTTTISPADNY